jgi:diamine N-acetyltransferase
MLITGRLTDLQTTRLTDLQTYRLKTKTLLSTENVRLRPVELTDVDFIYRLENDPANWGVSNTLVPFSRFQLEQYVLTTQHDIHAEKQLRMMIDTKVPEGEFTCAGMIDLFDFDPKNRRAGVGIILSGEFRKRGFASETLNLLIRYCFYTLDFHQLYCTIEPTNTDSIRLFTGQGFVQTGIRKEWILQDGRWLDEIVFQLIKP